MTKLKVEEMSCSHCVASIGKALSEINIQHTIDLDSKSVTIEGSNEDVSKAIAELDDIGYTAIVEE
jgi:copper chaperone